MAPPKRRRCEGAPARPPPPPPLSERADLSATMRAAARGDVDVLAALCDAELVARDAAGSTAAHIAAAANQAGVLYLLDGRGGAARELLSTADSHGSFPIHIAARADAAAAVVAICRVCTRRGARPAEHERDGTGLFPAQVACAADAPAALAALIKMPKGEATLDMDCDEGRSAAFHAARAGATRALRTIAAHAPGRLTHTAARGLNIAHAAAGAGHADTLRFIAEARTTRELLQSPETRHGHNPAHVAAERGHGACMYVIGEYAPDALLQADVRGMTPAAIAAMRGHVDALSAIYAQGGRAAATLRGLPSGSIHIDVAAGCIAAVAVPPRKSAAQCAAMYDQLAVLRMVAASPDLADTLHSGSTPPAVYAARAGSVEVLEFIHGIGGRAAQTVAQRSAHGALCAAEAARAGHLAAVAWLHDQGGALRASFGQPDGSGLTAFLVAVACDHGDIVAALLERSPEYLAHVDAGTDRTCFAIAVGSGAGDSLAVLLEARRPGAPGLDVASVETSAPRIAVSLGIELRASLSLFEYAILLWLTSVADLDGYSSCANELAARGEAGGEHPEVAAMVAGGHVDSSFWFPYDDYLSDTCMRALPVLVRGALVRAAWAQRGAGAPRVDVTTPRAEPMVALVQLEARRAPPGAPLHIGFAGELAAGDGLRREWIALAAEELTRPERGLFAPTAEGYLVPVVGACGAEELRDYERLGRVLGHAVMHGEVVGAQLCETVVAHALGIPQGREAAAAIDRQDYAARVTWIDGASAAEWEAAGLELSFVDDETGQCFGPPGELVTYASRAAYTAAYAAHRVRGRYARQLDALRAGIALAAGARHRQNIADIYTAAEARGAVCGAREVDIDALERGAAYIGGYTDTSRQVRWLWAWVRDGGQARARDLLRFATGAGALPAAGVGALGGYGGRAAPFAICPAATGGDGRLPSASTCLNRVMLPEYSSEAALRAALGRCMEMGAGYDEAAVSAAVPVVLASGDAGP